MEGPRRQPRNALLNNLVHTSSSSSSAYNPANLSISYHHITYFTYTVLYYTILYYTPYTTLECDVQDQEKQRSLERRRREDAERKEEPGRGDRRREEVDGVHKLHARLKQEQQMWDRECLARDKQQVCYAILCYAIIA